jgi:hypothetical protein
VNCLGHVFLAVRRSGSALFAGTGRARLLRQETRVRRPDGRGPGAGAGASDRRSPGARPARRDPGRRAEGGDQRLNYPMEWESTWMNVGGTSWAGQGMGQILGGGAFTRRVNGEIAEQGTRTGISGDGGALGEASK